MWGINLQQETDVLPMGRRLCLRIASQFWPVPERPYPDVRHRLLSLIGSRRLCDAGGEGTSLTVKQHFQKGGVEKKNSSDDKRCDRVIVCFHVTDH